MFLVGMITWWYGRGWQGQFDRVKHRLAGTAEFFSIGQLLRTVFSPFRQISAGRMGGSLSIVIRSFFDRALSRVIGSIVRSLTILFGSIVILLQAIYEGLILLFWFALPLFPIVGLIMMATGWVPSWT